ncbi:hypothetical protein Tco_0692988 [Tanacetum coccineum]
MAPLPPRDQRHLWLRYQDLAERVRMVYTGDDCQEVFMSHAWGRLFEIQAPLVQEFILEFFSTCRIGLHTSKEIAEDEFSAYWLGSERVIPDKGDLSDYWVEISSGMKFFRGAPSYTYIRDPVRRLCHSMDRGVANISYSLAQYLFKHVKGRKSDARLSRGHFIGCIAHHFGLVNDDGLRGLSFVTRAKRQPVVAAATPGNGFMNGTKTCHGYMKSHGRMMENGKNLHQLSIIASLLIIKLDVRSGQPTTREKINIYEDLKDSKLKDEALRNKAIMEGLINEDDESNNDEFNIRRFEMIKYSLRDDEEYVAVKEDEYDDLTSTSKDACRAYQGIFRMMDEGWMVTCTE